MEYTLTMVFTTITGEKLNLNISKVRDDLNTGEIDALMDKLIEVGVVANAKGSLVSKVSAKVTGKKVTSFNVA